MVRDQGPSATLSLGFLKYNGQAVEEGLAVFVILEDIPSLYTPCHDVLQKARGVKSRLAGHNMVYLVFLVYFVGFVC